MLAALRLGHRVVDQSAQAGLWSPGSLFRRWFREDDGQDLIEYALLCSAIGFAGAVAFSFISDAMNTTYTSWDETVQDDVLVEVPCPTADADCTTP